MSKPKPKAKPAATEADIVTNHALLLHAEASRLAKSWLRPSGAEDDPEKAEEELDLSSAAARDRYSETGGVGYHAPEGESLAKDKPSSTYGGADKTTAFLRRQLLHGQRRGGHQPSRPYQKDRSGLGSRSARNPDDDDDDDEESRSGLGRRKAEVHKDTRSKSSSLAIENQQPDTPSTEDVAETGADMATTTTTTANTRPVAAGSSSRKRGASSYLDELLASRAAKGSKKQKKGKG